jgi:hypothetical protein
VNRQRILSALDHRARALRNHFVFPALERPVVLIQSDDWGRVGIPSKDCIDMMRAGGLDVGRSPWDFYGLETEEDLLNLGSCLAGIRDRDGNPACFTANFVMANADLRRMREYGYRELIWKSIAAGFPEPWTEQLADTYRGLVQRGVFYPGLHGFTHFNIPALLDLLQERSARGEMARHLAHSDIPYMASLTPQFNFALLDGRTHDGHLLPIEAQAEWLEQGIGLFRNTFGIAPVTFCAPGYRADQHTRREAARNGIRVMQVAGRQIPMICDDYLLLVRNIAFEPALDGGKSMPDLLRSARKAVAAGVPIIVCSHSINYVSRFNDKAQSSRSLLKEFLERLRDEFPDLRFSNDASFEGEMRMSVQASCNKPDSAQVAARMRYFTQV